MAGLIPFNRRGLRTPGFDSFNNMLDDFFNDSWLSHRNLSYDTFKLDIRENDKEYFIDAEMPGIKKEEINLELNDGRLTISVQREENVENKDDRNFIHRERHYASMQRSVYLANANEKGISAKLEDGILKIIVPKENKTDNRHKINID